MISVANLRIDSLRRSIARHRLVFVQVGAVFGPIRDHIINELGGVGVSALEFAKNGVGDDSSTLLVLTGLEQFVGDHPDGVTSLGSLRDRVANQMDRGVNICLVSTAPRVSFGAVPGSSVLEDSALCTLPLIGEDEVDEDARARPGWQLPAVSCAESDVDLSAIFTLSLKELGTGVLSALDHALFEISPRSTEGLRFLANRDLEALKSAGLVCVDGNGGVNLSVVNRTLELKNALAEILSAHNDPPSDLGSVMNGLWYIERTIRAALRRRALELDGDGWRASIITGGLADEVLRRARLDASTSAASVKELRDPIEWLALGELMDIVTSARFRNLGVDAVLWRRFNEQLVPVRNRLSHMRFLKSGDDEIVSMWVGVVRQQLRG